MTDYLSTGHQIADRQRMIRDEDPERFGGLPLMPKADDPRPRNRAEMRAQFKQLPRAFRKIMFGRIDFRRRLT